MVLGACLRKVLEYIYIHTHTSGVRNVGVKRRDEGNAVQWYGSSNHNFVIPILIFFLFIYLFIYFGVSVVPSILIPMALIVGVGYHHTRCHKKNK